MMPLLSLKILGGTDHSTTGLFLELSAMLFFPAICHEFVKGTCAVRYGGRSEMCSIYYMFYANSSTIGNRSSQECRHDDLPHFTRRLLDHRELLSQMKHMDEVYPSKQHRSRRRSDGFSAAVDPLEALDLASSDIDGDRLWNDDGSGEWMPSADEITEGFADAATARQMTVPYASVVFPPDSTSLRTFSHMSLQLLCYCRVA